MNRAEERAQFQQQIAVEAAGLLDALIQIHERVQMDTEEDRELHARVIATFKSGLAAVRDGLAVASTPPVSVECQTDERRQP